MSKKIIHVMLDEKFNEMAIRQFESAMPGVHEYWVTAKSISMTKSPLIRRCDQDELVKQLRRGDVAGAIFHSLPPDRYPLLEKIDPGITVVWLGWGYDYYALLKHEGEYSRILPKSRTLAKWPAHLRVKSKVRSLLSKLKRPGIYDVSSLRRVDYFSPVLDLEYDMVKRHVFLNAAYVEWNYGNAEDDLSLPGAGFSEGNNILVGNSASATNNHVELFDEIAKEVNLDGRKIIAPLSYGDPYYRDRVVEVGEKMFGEAFVPLIDFMPVDQYLATIRSCGFVMMNHLRQQALGNICMAMLMGAKVYLNDGNPLSKWLSQRGAVFGSIDRLDMLPLTQSEREINSRMINSHWGREVQRDKTRRLIDLILIKEPAFS